MVNLGEVKCYLGVEFIKDQAGHFLIHQESYIDKILTQARLDDARPSTYPMDKNYGRNRIDSPEVDILFYRKLIGKLLHVSVNSPPDIAAPVAILAQHIKDTRQTDWNEL